MKWMFAFGGVLSCSLVKIHPSLKTNLLTKMETTQQPCGTPHSDSIHTPPYNMGSFRNNSFIFHLFNPFNLQITP